MAGRGTSPSNLQSIVSPMFFVSHLKGPVRCLDIKNVSRRSFDFQGQRPSQRSRRHGTRVVGALTVGQTMGTSEREEIIKSRV